MNKTLQQAYENCGIGKSTWVKPDTENGENLEAFQVALEEAEALEDQGKIRILSVHNENQTSRKLVDIFRIERLE